ncbi:YceI family protein [Saccharopolyspora taberi]|uniref:YceI family protein n=1 Tax=Saccharopolyspora taberi TaxID=60895 RepID=A0ABN3VFQ4_9PSEU
MIFSRLRGRKRAVRAGTGSYLPPIPLDGGVISCQVHDEQGRLLPGAEISVVDRFSREIASGETDAYGSFLVAVSPGTHKLSVTAGGYRRTSVQVEVGVNQHVVLNRIELEPDASLTLPQPGVWTFDPTHTEVHFVAQHIGMSKIRGRFNDFRGHIRVAPRFEDSEIEVVIDAASIDTGVRMRDDHLRSADFLDVANYPRLTFRSSRLVLLRGDQWQVEGSLTLRATTSPVRLDTTYLGQRKWQGPGFDSDLRVACRAVTSLRREDYAVDWRATLAKGIAVVGPTVQIELGVQAVLER